MLEAASSLTLLSRPLAGGCSLAALWVGNEIDGLARGDFDHMAVGSLQRQGM